MASVDGQEYASPSKRIKLDLTDHLANSNVELDFGTHSTPTTMVHENIEGPCSTSTSEPSSSNLSNFSTTKENFPDTSLPSCSSSSNNMFKLDTSDDTPSQDNDDERDEVSSTVSNLSDLSGLSEISGQEWKPMAGPMCWIQKQMMLGVNPRALLSKLLGEGGTIPADIDDLTLWKIIVNIMTEPPRRPKLKNVNTLSDVVDLLRSAKKIIVLTGAGVSVSCGIPDFRSRGGIYSRLALDFPDLPDPQSMFDISYFRRDPRPFFKFAREIYPGQFSPSPCHRFIRALERQRKLLRNYSQNIDTLEQVAGIENVIECHGSFATASCTNCKHRVSADDIRADIFAQRIPLCPLCHLDETSSTSANGFDMSRDYYKELVARGVMKPDIVFFGEGLPDSFHDSVAADKDQVDLMIVIGSTLKVRPVALIPSSIPLKVPQILINREPLPHLSFDVELLGDSDVIINQLCHMLGPGWEEVSSLPSLHEACRLRPPNPWEDSLDDDAEAAAAASSSSSSATCPKTGSEFAPSPSFESDSAKTGSEFSHSPSFKPESAKPGSEFAPLPSFKAGAVKTGSEFVPASSLEADSLKMGSAFARSSCLKADSVKAESGFAPWKSESTSDSSGCISPADDAGGKSVAGLLAEENAAKDAKELYQVVGSSQMSVDSGIGLCNSKERHMSIDSSTRDSGLCVDSPETLEMASEKSGLLGEKTRETRMSVDSDGGAAGERRMSVDSAIDDEGADDITRQRKLTGGARGAGGWAAKTKESIAARLPDDSFFRIPPSRYIFPGAEVFCETVESSDQSVSGSSDSSLSSDSDDDSDANATLWRDLPTIGSPSYPISLE